MAAVAIGALEARYRLAGDARDTAGAQTRLDAVLATILEGDAVEAVLERAGVGEEEEVCLRSVSAVVDLRLSATDGSLAATWAESIAEAMVAAARAGGAEMARYPTRGAALVDLALGVAVGDDARAWAWRRLELWPGATRRGGAVEPADLVSALTLRPVAIVPVLAELGRRERLGALHARLTAEEWRALARAAAATAGADPALADAAGRSAEARGARAAGSRAHRAARIADASAIARGLAADVVAPDAALAMLAALEVDPAGVAGSAAEGRALVADLWDAMSQEAGERTEAEARPAPSAPREQEAARRRTEPPGALETPEAPEGEAVSDGHVAPARPEPALPRPPGDDGLDAPEPDPSARSVSAPADTRRRGHTEAAGLLFLLRILDELDVAGRLSGPEGALSGRPSRWCLHRLARTLGSLPGDDPAALAFAGLAPGDPPPDAGVEDATAEEDAAILVIADEVASRLAALLEREDEPREDVLAQVVERAGEVVADPGWIEVRLQLRDVSLDLRRVGLDLDPGHLPWLGAVVRFVYA